MTKVLLFISDSGGSGFVGRHDKWEVESLNILLLYDSSAESKFQ